MKKAFFDFGPGVLRSEAWDERWKEYEIIGVEPDVVRYNNLKETYPGILLNVAVSDKIGKSKFVKHPTSGYIAFSYPDCNETIEVETITADELDKKYGPFDEIAIWADIEGSELRMLKGATEVLKKVKWINLELHTGPKTEEWARSNDIFKFLTDLNFMPDSPEKDQTQHDSSYDIVFTRQNILLKTKKITAVTTVLCPSETALVVIEACMQTIRNAVNKVNGEYIVVDDNSAVGAEFFKNIADIYFKNEKTSGVSISLNKGMKAATGEFVVKIDSDYLVPEDLFEILLKDWTDDCCFIAPSYLLTSVKRIDLLNVSFLPTTEGGVYDRPPGIISRQLKTPSAYQWGGGIMMFSTEAIKSVNYFDEDFGIGGAQDNDIIYRLLMKGYNWKWDNNVVTRHFSSVSSRDAASTQDYDEIRQSGNSCFMKKHGFEAGGCISMPYQHFKYKFEE